MHSYPAAPTHRIAPWLGAITALLLVGCSREATGQVAAVVGDDEITLQEINAEVGNAQLPAGVDKKAVQNAALQRIIDRRLMAHVARDDGLDKQPEFILRRKQLEDVLLAQMVGQKINRTARVPTQADIDKYVAQHPAQFGQREVWALDQIQFAMPADPSRLVALEADHSMDAVAERLKNLGIEFKRGPGRLDTLLVPPELLKSVSALPPGEPFILPLNGTVTVAVVSSRNSAPVTGEEARPIALQKMRSETLAKAVDQRLKAQKAKVKIQYQNGFGPPANGSAAGKSPPAKS